MKRNLLRYSYYLVLPGLILIFLFDSLPLQLSMLSLLLLIALFHSRRRDILRFFSRFWILLFITLIIHLFLRFDQANYWQAFHSWNLWRPALFFTTRNANILLLMSLLLKSGKTLSFPRLAEFLEKSAPSFLAQPLLLAMRYSLLIQEEFRSLQQLHRIMGIVRPRRLLARVKYYIDMVFPAIIASLERAEHLSIAMTSRGYNKE